MRALTALLQNTTLSQEPVRYTGNNDGVRDQTSAFNAAFSKAASAAPAGAGDALPTAAILASDLGAAAAEALAGGEVMFETMDKKHVFNINYPASRTDESVQNHVLKVVDKVGKDAIISALQPPTGASEHWASLGEWESALLARPGWGKTKVGARGVARLRLGATQRRPQLGCSLSPLPCVA